MLHLFGYFGSPSLFLVYESDDFVHGPVYCAMVDSSPSIESSAMNEWCPGRPKERLVIVRKKEQRKLNRT